MHLIRGAQGEFLGATAAGQYTHADFHQTNVAFRGCHNGIGMHGELATAAEHIALRGYHHRNGRAEAIESREAQLLMTKPRRTQTASAHRYPRTARLNESLREVIAEELIKIDDERLSLVTITAIDGNPLAPDDQQSPDAPTGDDLLQMAQEADANAGMGPGAGSGY